MVTIVTRAGKGSPLTHNEVDANFTNLNTGKVETAGFDAAVAATPAVTANTAKVTNATHTGEVTGSGALTITADAVDNTKLANMATARIKGRVTAGTGDPEDLTGTQATTLLDTFTSALKGLVPASGGGTTTFLRADGTFATPAGGGGGTVTDADYGDITVSGTGTVWTIDNGVVSLAKMANVATATVFYRKTAGTGAPEVQTLATLKTDLGLTGTNSGDQTITLTGDVTGIGTGSFAATIANDAVIYAKMQNVSAASKLLGRGDSGSGDVQEITLGSNLTMTGTTLSASGGGGATVITAAPSTDQSNWAPSGLGTGAVTVLMQPTTNSFIGGLVAGANNQEVLLVNDSDFVVMLIGEDASSTAANRFTLSRGSYILLPQEDITFRYSATKSRWRKINVTRNLYEVDNTTQMTLPNTGATVSNVGIHASSITATVSTTASTATPTDDFLEYSYWQITNSTGSGSTDVRSNATWLMRGATAGRQGFLHTGRVRFPALGATGAVYAGLINSAAATTTQPSAFTNALMLGAQNGATNLSIYFGSGTPGTPISLGANFPVPSAPAAYEYLFFSLGGGTAVEYMVRRMDTRFVAQGTLTTNLPVNTTPMGHRTGAMVGATAVANTVQCNYLLSMGL